MSVQLATPVLIVRFVCKPFALIADAVAVRAVNSGQQYNVTIAANSWAYFSLANGGTGNIDFETAPLSTSFQDCDIYVSYGQLPNKCASLS